MRPILGRTLVSTRWRVLPGKVGLYSVTTTWLAVSRVHLSFHASSRPSMS